MCVVEMQLRAAQRRYEAIHKDAPFHNGDFTSWSKDLDDDHPFHYEDGVTIWLSPVELDPDDDFLSDPREQQPRAAAEDDPS